MRETLKFTPCAFFSLMVVLPLSLSACADRASASDSRECKVPVIHGNVSLQPSCVYHQEIMITRSHTTLDCHGAILDGRNEKSFGIVVNSKGKPLSDVTIKNCKIQNYTHSGIRITSDIAANKLSPDHAENYRRTPTRVNLENVEVTGSGRVGIYFDDYVTHSTLKNSVVRDSYMSGIYLEHSSRNNAIVGNQIINNGHESFGKGKREGLAVDSSAYNLIEGNRFESNGAGGVFLYKNCGEHFSTGKSVIRWQHSDHNVIRNNTFVNEPVGIWLASRQNRDLSGFDCGDKPRDGSGKYFNDYADDNLVEGNRFVGDRLKIMDEGKRNGLWHLN
jgi:parallel beta-helix repeat protein